MKVDSSSTIPMPLGHVVVAIHLAKRTFLLLLLVLSFSACSTYKSIRPLEIQVEAPEQEALRAIQGTNTSFLVPYENDGTSWERVYMFFKFHLKTTATVKDRGRQALGESANYRYAIARSYQPEGVKYKILCKEKASGQFNNYSKLNAQNLSRFIQNGILELDLIKL